MTPRYNGPTKGRLAEVTRVQVAMNFNPIWMLRIQTPSDIAYWRAKGYLSEV